MNLDTIKLLQRRFQTNCKPKQKDVDALIQYYKEIKDGQILEEGINEAGSMSSFIAAGTAYSTQGINTIPFYIDYSIHYFLQNKQIQT